MNNNVTFWGMELTKNKAGDPEFVCWMRTEDGLHTGEVLTMRQTIKHDYQIVIVNDFLRAVCAAIEAPVYVTFSGYRQYAGLISSIAALLDCAKAYDISALDSYELKRAG